jgi:hypothetical protein
MSTHELERLLENALHETDQVPVDVPGARAQLLPLLDEQHRAARRLSLVGVAAAVLAAVVAGSLVLVGLRDDPDPLPVRPAPGITLSPSGLPVGLLEAKVGRSTGNHVVSTVHLVVRPDGTGVFNAGTPQSVGPEEGASTADYAVKFVSDGPGRADMTNVQATCYSPQQLRLTFAVRSRTVVVKDAASSGCLVSRALAADLTGTTMRILPLPVEPSPSGLPVGLLEGFFDHPVSQLDLAHLRFWVRRDGTGEYHGGGDSGVDGARFQVAYVGAGPGRAVMLYDTPNCADPAVLTLDFTVRGQTVRLGQVSATGCVLSKELAADMTGGTLRIRPLS